MIPSKKQIEKEQWFERNDEENQDPYKYDDPFYYEDDEEKDDYPPRSPFDRDVYEPDAWEKAQKEDEGLGR